LVVTDVAEIDNRVQAPTDEVVHFTRATGRQM